MWAKITDVLRNHRSESTRYESVLGNKYLCLYFFRVSKWKMEAQVLTGSLCYFLIMFVPDGKYLALDLLYKTEYFV